MTASTTRESATRLAARRFDEGHFQETLSRLIAIPSESQNPDRAADLHRYLEEGIGPLLDRMDFNRRTIRLDGVPHPIMIAERIEDPALPTVLGYGHGDVIRGQDAHWSAGLSPWTLRERDGRWYGRGIADNKGPHLVNLTALGCLLEAGGGKLGFNARFLIETGEETGSPGLRQVCVAERETLAADLLIASDGPRLSIDRPTLALGARGALPIDLRIEARAGGHHSGNWGGLISNPGIELAHAIALIVGPTGQIRIPELVPDGIPPAIRAALADCVVDGGPAAPAIEPHWGEPGLSAAEKVFGWCNFEVLAFETGNPRAPVNAIPPSSFARCQLRFVKGIDPQAVIPAIRRTLARHGLGHVVVEQAREDAFPATRMDPDHPVALWAAESIERSTGARPNILPNIGGGLPNDAFAEIIGMPTLWVPHSYPGCSQHAPDEHLPASLLREALMLMVGLYADVPALALDQPVRGTRPSSG